MLTTEQKSKVIKDHQTGAGDVGSTEVQVALLTERINQLTEHLKINKKDLHSERGLELMVEQRKRLLKYLAGRDQDAYQALVKKLNLRK